MSKATVIRALCDPQIALQFERNRFRHVRIIGSSIEPMSEWERCDLTKLEQWVIATKRG